MYPALQKEVELYKKRTPRSQEAHTKAAKHVPLGVASNGRFHADIDRHLQAFAEIAPALATAQHERQNVPAHV